MGAKGLFTKEIEEALLDGRADLAVHSLKDLPTELPAGLVLAATPEREDPRDALVGRRLADLPAGAKLGTSSLRRAAQLRKLRPDLRIEPVRGNLDTRLRKLDGGRYDAIVLAAAGLKRLGWGERIAEILSPEMSARRWDRARWRSKPRPERASMPPNSWIMRLPTMRSRRSGLCWAHWEAAARFLSAPTLQSMATACILLAVVASPDGTNW